MLLEDFRAALKYLGLPTVRFARLMGVSDTTARAWIAGDKPPPELVCRILRLAVAGKFDLDRLLD